MNNYFLLHGSFSSPFSNWIPYLREKLESLEKIVYTPDLPSGVGYQSYDSWKKIMDVYLDCGLINENTIIFAHSIAPVFIAKYLVEKKIKVERLIFVSGFNNLSDIKGYAKEIVCLYSDNDPYVKYDVEKDFAETVTNNVVIYPNGGHLNSESGFTEFSDLLKYI